jgi:hypothetical protein
MVAEGQNSPLGSVQENIKKFKSKLRQVKNAIRAISLMKGFK